MKKIVITLALIMPLFLINNIQAQSNPNLPHFDAYVVVTNAPTQCPSDGLVTGYVEPLDYTYTNYNGVSCVHYLLWDGNFAGYEDVFVSVKTNDISPGKYCYDDQTKTLTGSDYGEYFYLNLTILVSSSGGGDDPD